MRGDEGRGWVWEGARRAARVPRTNQRIEE
eukprot:SAG11_NODE_39395_length_233_cov_5.820896_1_plen_29_part_10